VVRIRTESLVPGALYHLTQRGVGKAPLFRDDPDRLAFLWLLGRTARRFRWEILAWCLMDNHVHLLLRDRAATLPRGAAALFGAYSSRFNRRHGRVGHLYQGRYRAFVVLDEAYLSNVIRYVLRNPLKAGAVRDLVEWRWSSFPATAGLAPMPNWMTPDAVLAPFNGNRAFFRAFVERGVDEWREPWERIGRPL
jgi:REP element-mobilizing transposase RayT